MKKIVFSSILIINYLVCNGQDRNHRDSIDVIKYVIHLDLSELATKQLKGKTEITFVPVFDNQNTVKLDFEGLKVDQVKLQENNLKFSQSPEILSVLLNSKLSTHDTITLIIQYHGTPKHDRYWGGFFMDGSFAYNYGIGMFANPPNYGRVWYPCIDSFTDRAFYEYYIKTSKNHLAACPGLLQSVTELENDLKLYHWKLNQNIPTYLSSVAVGDYALISDTVKGIERIIPVECYVNRNQRITALKTFENVKDFVHAFEYRFGPYCWDKIGYVSTPFNDGAMEHATNIAYGSYCNETTNCEQTLAHELSHHWFGNLVTCRTEKDMWLNEGWARFCEAIYYEYKYGIVAYKNQIRKNHTMVLNRAYQNNNEFGALYGMPHSDTYGNVVYDKGGDVAHTLRGQLGDSLFFSSLKLYFKKYAFKDISVSEFKEFLGNSTKTDLNDFFSFWIYGKGFPHFTITDHFIEKQNNGFKLDLEITQNLIHTDDFVKSLKLEVGVLDKDLKMHMFPVTINGELFKKSFFLDFKPVMILIDPEEKIADACTDEYLLLNEKSEYRFDYEDFKLSVNQIDVPVFFSIVKHWISPVNEKNNPDIHGFSDKYWEIQFSDEKALFAGAYFYFQNNDEWYKKLKTSKIDNIKLFYRQNIHQSWQQTKAELKIQNGWCWFYIGEIRSGQYVVASNQ